MRVALARLAITGRANAAVGSTLGAGGSGSRAMSMGGGGVIGDAAVASRAAGAAAETARWTGRSRSMGSIVLAARAATATINPMVDQLGQRPRAGPEGLIARTSDADRL